MTDLPTLPGGGVDLSPLAERLVEREEPGFRKGVIAALGTGSVPIHTVTMTGGTIKAACLAHVNAQVGKTVVLIRSGPAWVIVGALDHVWTDFTPTISQGPSLAFTNHYSRYVRLGRIVIVQSVVGFGVPGPAATPNTPILFTLPIPGATTHYRTIGSADFYDASVPTKYNASCEMNGSNTIMRFNIYNASGDAVLGANAPFAAAIAPNDALTLNCMYEAAT